MDGYTNISSPGGNFQTGSYQQNPPAYASQPLYPPTNPNIKLQHHHTVDMLG